MRSRTITIASLTIREAMRRRLLAALAAITIVLVALSAWGFDRLSHSMFMFSFVVALSASAIASPAISSEVESGVLMTVVSRPIRRSEILIGKWLGLAAMLLGYAAGVCLLEMGTVDAVSGYLPPNPVLVTVYLFCEGLLLLTLALVLSTRLPTMAAGVLGIAFFGGAWLAGVVGTLGTTFNIPALRAIGQVARFVLPTDGLWHGAIYYLEPSSLMNHFVDQNGRNADPFLALGGPSWPYLLWVAVWFVAVMAAGVVSFERREL
jgi:ABC-type transport system involved in multi-copper enzyme maturation permease subunit